ncbi:hypothetical protein HDU67_002474 [Dinochytrium kinnereticum]|nr:hypothetical protein HDU67_002474 [Dinochytrium kinnereticum]
MPPPTIDATDDGPKGFDWKPFLPSMIMGQTRRRLTAAVPDTLTNKLVCAAVAGAGQAAVALLLKAPSALEKRPEEIAIVNYYRKNPWGAMALTMLRNAAGFTVFFAIYDALKAKPDAAKKAIEKLFRNLFATILAVAGYRLTTWTIDGKLPTDVSQSGKQGGNPYSGAIQRLKTSMSKAAISMAVMDSFLGRPGW